jgi:hypothetical protein
MRGIFHPINKFDRFVVNSNALEQSPPDPQEVKKPRGKG